MHKLTTRNLVLRQRSTSFALVLSVFASVGCDSSESVTAESARLQSSDLETGSRFGTPIEDDTLGDRIDAGVVLADRQSYLLIPLDKLRDFPAVDHRANLRLTTSCECVKASLLRYVTTSGDSAEALHLRFVPTKDEHFDRGRRLGVEIYAGPAVDLWTNAVRS